MKYKLSIILILILLSFAAATYAEDSFTTGLKLFNAGKWTQAADMLVKASTEQPMDVVVRITAGVALANVKRYSDAAAQFEEAKRVSPDGVLPLLLLDGAYTEMNDQERAQRAREQARKLIDSRRAFGKPVSSDKLLMMSISKYPMNAIAHLLLGDLNQLNNDLGQAKKHYLEAEKLAPKWVKPVFNLGIADLKTDPKTAEDLLTQAAAIDPSNRRIQLWLGDAYLGQGKVNQALDAYKIAGTDASLSAEAQTRIGNAQLRSGNYGMANTQFYNASLQAPNDPRPIVGQAQALQNEGKLDKAEAKYSEAASVLASNNSSNISQAAVQNQIAKVRIQKGNYEKAVESLEAAFRLHPNLENASALASAYQKDGKLDTSIKLYEAGLQKDRQNVPAMLYLLSAYKLTGNIQGRSVLANRLIRMDKVNSGLYYAELGAVFMAMNNETSAVKAYMNAFKSVDLSGWDTIISSAIESKAAGSLIPYYKEELFNNRNINSGMLLYELQSALKDKAGMLDTAKKLVEIEPKRPSFYLRLGESYEANGNIAEAISTYRIVSGSSDTQAATAANARLDELKEK